MKGAGGPARELELTIDSLAYQGAGVGRHEGIVVFVPFAAPGDRVRVRVSADRGRYLEAELVEVLAPGPARVQAPCPHFGVCGGCQWQHVAYAAQLEAKRTIVADALRRIGGTAASVQAVVPSPLPYRYRNRVRFHVDATGRAGFYRRGSHAVVEIASCPLLDERLDGAIAGLRGGGPRGPAEVELAVGDDGRVSEAEGLPFGQVNAAVNELLRRRLETSVDGVFGAQAAISVLDLYCGDGNLSLPLAAPGRSVLGFDASPAAAGAAAARARALGVSAEFRAAAVSERLLRSLGRRRFELLIADPPRAGLAALARAVAALGAPLVALVSCAPPMLARDLRAFLAAGYRLDLVQPFDMFPQTFHVETLAVLRSPVRWPQPVAQQGATRESHDRILGRPGRRNLSQPWQAERVYLSSIVVGELLYGFRGGTRYAENRSQLETFLANRFVEFLPVTLTTADRFGLIAAALKRKGSRFLRTISGSRPMPWRRAPTS